MQCRRVTDGLLCRLTRQMVLRVPPEQHHELHMVLMRAQALGFLGPVPVVKHIDHAVEMIGVCEAAGLHERLLDLGSGGGVPGLVMGAVWQSSAIVLLEVNRRRAAFLRDGIRTLSISDRVSVLSARAEDAGRLAEHRAQFDMVVARGFGRPGVVAECGAPFLRKGGKLVVSEPPARDAGSSSVMLEQRGLARRSADSLPRWPAAGLSLLGLTSVGIRGERFRFQVLELGSACPEKYPRRVGVPDKRPVF